MIPLPRFEIRKSKKPFTRQKFYVVLIAENCKELSRSEMLSSEGAAMSNVESQMANVPNCERTPYKDY